MSSPRNRRRRQTSPATKSKAPKINPSVTWVAGPIHFSSKAYFKKKPAASNKTKTPIPRNHFWPTATSVEERSFPARGAATGGAGEESAAICGAFGNGGGVIADFSAFAAVNASTDARRVAISLRSAASSEKRLKSSEHFGQIFAPVSVWHLGQSIGPVRHGNRPHAILRLLTDFK